ncbi:hypothetical protein BpHYR1_016263 [Brachionus plicatilis]|uniref:Uncharacterized protein n=1 Tax=Brachionus plicatilis TaxID=10195 RepID=A0A3M7RK58_BRAPC|nr:hypothetical protein BpHYR1_016263 [Brachionus plicatilis]
MKYIHAIFFFVINLLILAAQNGLMAKNDKWMSDKKWNKRFLWDETSESSESDQRERFETGRVGMI